MKYFIAFLLIAAAMVAGKADEKDKNTLVIKSIKSQIDTIIQIDTVKVVKTDTIIEIDTVIVKELLQLNGEVSVFVRKSNDSVISIDLVKKPVKKKKSKKK